MYIIFADGSWMMFNILLAFIPVITGWLMYDTKNTWLRLLFGSIWFVFLPNTIYMLTDFIHLQNHLPRTTGVFSIILVLLYGLLFAVSVGSYLLALYPFDRLITHHNKKPTHVAFFFILLVNIVVGFGVMLGRVERTNSWEIAKIFDWPVLVVR